MRKIIQPYTKKLDAVILYKDDLDKIEKILKDDGGLNFEFIINDEAYNSVSEISSSISKTHRMNITAREPSGDFLEISFSRTNYFEWSLTVYPNYLYINNCDNQKLFTIIHKIEKVLNPRQRKLSTINYIIIGPYVLLFIILFVIGIITKIPGYFFASVLVGIVFAITDILIKLADNNIILFSYEKDNPNFWNRTKDQLLVNIISGIIGTAMGTIIGILIQKYFHLL